MERPKTDFFNVLRSRVNEYFDQHRIERTGDYRMVMKSVAMFTLYLAPFAVILTGVLPAWATLLCWVLMGLGMAGGHVCRTTPIMAHIPVIHGSTT